ncbi:Hypothetical predicted protein [Pelobates cultripes]|uniref:Uncharacterized protein n=1 Tax=Pelobates cultripes TaxID=61616 RepID=A0AAD1VM49_PELCU|nr:Hypothetical predicted protein [Pelobates cultripes]
MPRAPRETHSNNHKNEEKRTFSTQISAAKPPSTADIGELLRRPQNFQRPDMAPQLEGLYHSFSETTESEEEDYGTGAVGRPIQSPTKPSLTEEKLKVILGELRRNIAADIGVFRDKISGVVARLQNAELNTAAQESHLELVEQQILTPAKDTKTTPSQHGST